MKSIVFLFAAFNSTHPFEKVFGNQSAFERALIWAKERKSEKIVIAVNPHTESEVRNILRSMQEEGCKIIQKEKWLVYDLLESLAECRKLYGVEKIFYTFADRPFLDSALTEKILETQEKYMAEYSFQDGYPEGFAPEIIASSTAEILFNIIKMKAGELGKNEVAADSLFSIVKTDINSFDVESYMAPKDYRMLRLNFSCTVKRNFMACQRLYEKTLDKKLNFTADQLSELAAISADVQKTVPAFYNIQLCGCSSSFDCMTPYEKIFKNKFRYVPEAKNLAKENYMSLESFKALVKEITSLSEDAVLSLSAFGESLLLENLDQYIEEVLKNPRLSVLIETDGILVSPEFVSKVKAICDAAPQRLNGYEKIMWIVKMDSFSAQMYDQLHSVNVPVSTNPFDKVVSSVKLLAENFSEVYPQFVRMKGNEIELESFYRYFHDKNSITKGKLVIQKYDSFCGQLPDEKPCDLSPVTRNACWHLKRDMTILFNGDVPACRETIFENVVGNVLSDSLETIWRRTDQMVQNQLENKFEGKCGECDEYYTFNF